MKEFFDYILHFKYKNFFAAGLAFYMLYLLSEDPSLRESLIVMLTLIIKHFYDSNTGSAKKDETISTLAGNQSAPVIENSENTTVKTNKLD